MCFRNFFWVKMCQTNNKFLSQSATQTSFSRNRQREYVAKSYNDGVSNEFKRTKNELNELKGIK